VKPGSRVWNQERGPKPWIHTKTPPPPGSWWVNVSRQDWSTTIQNQMPRWAGTKDT